jgi:hypothetical protein
MRQPFISESKIRRLLRTAGQVQAILLERALDKIDTRRLWKIQRRRVDKSKIKVVNCVRSTGSEPRDCFSTERRES